MSMSLFRQCPAGLASCSWHSYRRQALNLPTLFAVSSCVAARGFRTTATLRERRSNRPNEGSFGTAGSLARAKHQSITPQQALSEIAFAFDIDGVIYRGHEPIPGAKEMLRSIRSHDIRYVFLTNGGGAHEDAKASALAKRLGLSEEEDVIRNRIILSHTPMRGWNESLKKNGTVLITGCHPEKARNVAIDYGFARAVTPADILANNEKVYPFDGLRDSLHSQFRELPDGKRAINPADPYSKNISTDTLKIDKILIWNDPRDWSLDIQIIHDLLVSHKGFLGTISEKNGNTSLPNNGWQQDGQPEIWISNLDLFWKTEYAVNRFGTGAFVDALKGVWTAVTEGAELQYKALGKPSKHTYQYAHDKLLHFSSGKANLEGDTNKVAALRRVYMIGDNPESDIRGANEFSPEDGTEWISILVRTGVWKQTIAEKEPRYKPTVIVDDVVDAIVWAMRNEGVEVTRESVMSGAY